ncbi:type VI secretion system tip protein VgrG, partial [Pectobacterium parmentieri]
VTFRAPPTTAWPKTHGPQTAKVVGPQGESIWTDRYGRVKVKFHWDRLAKGDDTSSCWVRVSSAWAGQGFGGVQIPRVGDEVVVDFINGDPDRPLIIGRVYNEASMPPWNLPEDATRMGFMSRSKDGHHDNSSFLFFEDKSGDELLNMHAEKDMSISVENDKTIAIEGCRTTTIGKEQSDKVTGDATFHYKQKRTTTVDDAEINTFNNGEFTTIKNGRTLKITSGGDEISINGDKKTRIKGDEKRELSGSLNEGVEGDVVVNINGNWDQTVVSGKINIFSPNEICIKSGKKVSIEAPSSWVKTALHSFSMTGFNESVTGNSVSFTGNSISGAGVSSSFTTVSNSLTALSNSSALVSYSIKTIDNRRSITKIEDSLQNLVISAIHLFI